MRDGHEHTVSLSFLLGAFSFFSGFFFSFSAAAGFRRFMACRSRDTSGVLAHFPAICLNRTATMSQRLRTDRRNLQGLRDKWTHVSARPKVGKKVGSDPLVHRSSAVALCDRDGDTCL